MRSAGTTVYLGLLLLLVWGCADTPSPDAPVPSLGGVVFVGCRPQKPDGVEVTNVGEVPLSELRVNYKDEAVVTFSLAPGETATVPAPRPGERKSLVLYVRGKGISSYEVTRLLDGQGTVHPDGTAAELVRAVRSGKAALRQRQLNLVVFWGGAVLSAPMLIAAVWHLVKRSKRA